MEPKIVDLEEILAIARNDGFRNQLVLIVGEPKTGKTETLSGVIAATPMRGYWYSCHVRCDVADCSQPLPRGRHGILYLDDVGRFVRNACISATSVANRIRADADSLCGTIIATEHAWPGGKHGAYSLAAVAGYILRTRVGEPGKYDLVKCPYTDRAEAPLG